MPTLNQLLASLSNVTTNDAETEVFATNQLQNEISELRYMVGYSVYIKNKGANGVDVKLNGSPKSDTPSWFTLNAYQTITGGGELIISGTADVLALQLVAKNNVAGNASTIDVDLVVKLRT